MASLLSFWKDSFTNDDMQLERERGDRGRERGDREKERVLSLEMMILTQHFFH